VPTVTEKGPARHLGAVLDELLDAIGELKQGRRQVVDPALSASIGALAADLMGWVPRVADAITAAGASPLAVATSVAGHHPILVVPPGAASGDVAAVLADHLRELAAHTGDHVAALPAEDPAAALLEEITTRLTEHEARMRQLAR